MSDEVKTAIIICEHGLGSPRAATYAYAVEHYAASFPAFNIDAATGAVLRVTVDAAAFGDLPATFDVEEYADTYDDRMPPVIHIDDIGYTTISGKRVSPSASYRATMLRLICRTFRDRTERLLAAVRTALPERPSKRYAPLGRHCDAAATHLESLPAFGYVRPASAQE